VTAPAQFVFPSTTEQFKVQERAGDRHMENKPAQNIQDTFLNTVRKDKTPITIYRKNPVV
jgi:hypothetical protein